MLFTDPSRFRLTHETSFVREHVNPWAKNRFSFYVVRFCSCSSLFHLLFLYISIQSKRYYSSVVTLSQMCFFRQMLRSVRKSDYLTMRHGFISVSSLKLHKTNHEISSRNFFKNCFKKILCYFRSIWHLG